MSFYDAIRVGASGAADYEIERSLRFNNNDSAYLNRTPSSASNRKTMTLSLWVKGMIGGTYQIFDAHQNDSNRSRVFFNDNGSISFFNRVSNSDTNCHTTGFFRDPSAWYHIVFAFDTTQASASNRYKIYINGVEQANDSNVPAQNTDLFFNSTNSHKIGVGGDDQGNENYFDGYMAEINFIDGLQLTPSSFGETDSTTGQWNPIDTSGLTFGTNGFRLNFANNDLFTNFTDSSSSAHTVTRNGDVIHKSDQTKNGATSIYFDGSGDTLTVPDSTDFTVGSGDFTIEAYIRRTSQGSDEWFFVQSDGTTAGTSIGLHIGSSSSGYANKPSFRYTEGSTGNELNGTTTLATNTWYHIAGVRQSNTVRIYVNGVQENSASYSGTVNDSSAPVVMGAVNSGGSAGFTGHMDQLRWSNSVRYPDGTSFTAPTTQFTADSNTKLLVQSNVTGDVGSDSSGNGNNFTPNNFSVSAGTGNDSLEDTPTNNFCTLNPLDVYGDGISEEIKNGNLDAKNTSGGSYRTTRSTFHFTTGKWYWEVKVLNAGSATLLGVAGKDYVAGSGARRAYNSVNGQKYIGSGSSYGASFTTNDIIGIALDLDNGTITFYKNGVSQGVAFTDMLTAMVDGGWTPIFNGYGNSEGAFNFGQRAFDYTQPTGYKSLCSANLPDPGILDPTKHFNTLLYTGTGSSQNITGLEFQPDWVWIKKRNTGENHNTADAVRGAGISLRPNTTGAETSSSGAINAFLSNGFTVVDAGETNESGHTYVGWNWNAGDTDGKTYTVKVVSDSGNKYRFDNFGTSAVTLDLAEGGTYIFNMDDSSNASHPFSIGTAANGTVYTSGITYFLDGVSKTYSQYTSGFSSASTRRLHITVPASAPVLYYWCSAHSGMGGQINTNSTLGSSNFDGDTQSTVKVNTTAGFSIVLFSGSGNRTIGHGLGVAPKAIIMKGRNVSDQWTVGHNHLETSNPWHKGQPLNSASGNQDNATFWNDTAPTSTVFHKGTWDDGYNMVAYCFSEVAGYSKFGSYTGNQNADGIFVFLGFRPAWVLVKGTWGGNWNLFDNKRPGINVTNDRLFPNLTDAETDGSPTDNQMDLLSNGFKLRGNNNDTNHAAGFIYLAFAELPFKNSRAR